MEEIRRVLRAERDRLTPSVIQMLRDKVSYWVKADISRAMILAHAAQEAATLTGDPLCQAIADHAYAHALHISGEHINAVKYYDRAERAYTQLGLEIEAAKTSRAKIGVLMYLGEYKKALDIAAEARRIFQKHGEDILLAQLDANVGSIYHRLDRYHEALEAYERARKIFAAHHDELALAFVDFNCANQYTCLNEFDRALDLYRQAGRVYEKLGMRRMVSDVEYSIAWLYYLRGHLHESLKLFARVRDRSLDLGDRVLEALCDLDLAEVYIRLNAYDDAMESAKSAAEKFTVLNMSYEYVKAKMYLGVVHMQLNDLATAERELQEVRRGFQAEGNEVFTAVTDVYLSDVLRRQHEWTRAVQLCNEADRIFNAHHLPAQAAQAQLHLARLMLVLGEISQAQQLVSSALSRLDQIEAPWLKYQGLHLLGNVLEQRGDRQEAYRCYQQAVEHLEGLRSTIQVDELKCTFLRDKLRVYEDLVELCLREGTLDKVNEALSYVEAAKSRALVELLATSQSIRSKASSPEAKSIYHRWQKLRQELNWYYNRMNYYELRAPQRPPWMSAQLRREIQVRERELAKLARRLHIEDAEYSSLQTVSRPDITELRQCLADDEVLLEYYIVKGCIKIFVVTREGVHIIHDVTTVGKVAPLLRRLRFYFDKFTLSGEYVNIHQTSLQAATTQCLMALYAELVEPVASHLKGRKVIFVPHEVLHYVPFHALHNGHGYLLDEYEISYCPSASVFKLCKEKAAQPRRRGPALIMGVPDEAMPYIFREVETVASLWSDALVFTGPEATLEQLKQNAPRCRLLHLATHGVFRRDNPMFSALKLADSWLSFYDIFNLTVNADLVTLSACETGMNEIFPGDELFGLMRGFLYAGAPSLVVSLWIVNDCSTAEFMRCFYSNLSDGLPKRTALRRAQQDVRQRYPHPYYWAPFILMGVPV
ncbi:MAG: CHAT domain-containing protein [Acidobacteria bacterium]|nr:MAG: CHAT domain-containing protein [Acidobacteriota bacterium]